MRAMHRACQLISEFAGGEFGPITVAENTAILPTREAIELEHKAFSVVEDWVQTYDFARLLRYPIILSFILPVRARL